MWKFHDFSITQILREINSRNSRRTKSVIFAILEALNFDFQEFLYFLKAENYQKMADFEVLDLQKLISRKI